MAKTTEDVHALRPRGGVEQGPALRERDDVVTVPVGNQGRKQIARGWAEVFVFEDPFRCVGRYRRAERRAEEGSRGVWDMCGGDFHKPL